MSIPTLVLAAAWLWLRLLRSRDAKYACALGVLGYVIVLYEPTPAVMGLLFVVLTAHALWRDDLDWRTAVRSTVIVVLGFGATYAVMFAGFGFDLAATVRDIGGDAVVFNTRASRPYGGWVAQNLLDFLFGVGICQAALFCWSLGRTLVTRHLGHRGAVGRMSAFTLGTAAALLAADLAGISRGEVVRLWIFLACVAQVPAAYVCARLNSRVALIIVLGATFLQNALNTSMFAFAQP